MTLSSLSLTPAPSPPSTTGIPYIPESAPFSSAQRQFLNGLLAGLFTANGHRTAAAPTLARLPVTILVGTESGNGTTLAQRFKKAAASKGLAPTVVDLGDFEPESIQDLEHVALITSTHGDGQPPENAHALYAYLFSEEAPRLHNLRFSVLALGDRNYPQFCQCGRDFDRRLEELGAQRYHERIDCDVDYDPPFAQWLEGVVASLRALDSSSVRQKTTSRTPETTRPGALPAPSKPAGYSRRNPFSAQLLKLTRLNAEGSSKDTRHVEIDLGDSGLAYEAGDALGVFPTNCPAQVQSILDVLNFDGEEAVQTHTQERLPLRFVLIHRYEIRNLKPGFLRRMSQSPGDESLLSLLGSDAPETLAHYIREREIIDVLLDHPGAIESPQHFLACLEPLQPRLYSIASSQKAVGNSVHLTVGVVRYESRGRQCAGVCSNFFADRAAHEGLQVFVQPNRGFRLPKDPSTPIIMVGPGTGLAPFRSFLQERAATGAEGDAWLFFGDRSSKHDFIYRDELENFLRSRTLTRLDTAWSRDQEQKIYVQDRIQENGAELFNWLEKGAVLYVCGDASRMARDVDAALRAVIRDHSGQSEEATARYLDKLRAEKRYLRDVY